MRRLLVIALLALTAAVPARAQDRRGDDRPATRFATYEVIVDSRGVELAAYQLTVRDAGAVSRIVGIEGGDHPAFAEPPYYDPRAMARDTVILAAYSLDGDLPAGRCHVATLHLEIAGDDEPDLEIDLELAADAQGEQIPASAGIERGDER